MAENFFDSRKLTQVASGIRMLALDVDGVLTDGRLHFDSKGKESKIFHAHDGYGIRSIIKLGLQIALISGRESNAVRKRAGELGIEKVFQGVSRKDLILQRLINECGYEWKEVAYVGDDIPDAECLTLAGLGVAVADAHADIKLLANWQTTKGGGRGAVREVCDLLFDAQSTKKD
ncbi:MAG: HAD-IIIA family hydrolase [Pseudomonadota bacterium]|nr:HAD-IIIA family hydrolase [Pseudomonadota bacterium]